MRKRKRKQLDPKQQLLTLAQRWVSGDESARKKAAPIFKKYPELMRESEFRMELSLYMEWHKFVASPYKEELTAAYEKWKQAPDDKKQKLAEQANTLYLELTGQEIPSVPFFGEDEEFEKFWETGTRYEEKLQKLRSEYGN